MPPPSSERPHTPNPRGTPGSIAGDYYAGNQNGGNVGGHGNNNAIIHQNDANLETLIDSIGLQADSTAITDEDLFASLSKIMGATNKCVELLEAAMEHEATIRNRLGLPLREVEVNSSKVNSPPKEVKRNAWAKAPGRFLDED
ncbi:hypothetical protein ONZ45_g10306 [Pleurotus djamor]|nr:hypothetical protein ONZ45_g10306 [Pleurotus djamor]